MRYLKELRDEVGNVYPRKNLYLLDLANATDKEVAELNKNKNSHPYIVALREYKEKEKAFYKNLAKIIVLAFLIILSWTALRF